MSAQHTPEPLIPAIRQYKHNDGSEGFVIAFDERLTIDAFAKLQQQRKELLAASKWVIHVLSLSGNDLLSRMICDKLEPVIINAQGGES